MFQAFPPQMTNTGQSGESPSAPKLWGEPVSGRAGLDASGYVSLSRGLGLAGSQPSLATPLPHVPFVWLMLGQVNCCMIRRVVTFANTLPESPQIQICLDFLLFSIQKSHLHVLTTAATISAGELAEKFLS